MLVTEDALPPVLAPETGVLSFHAATMFRTEVSGDRGEIFCGRLSEEPVGVVPVPVNVSLSVYVPV